MTTTQETCTYWVCVDCYFAHAGFGAEERGEDYPAETLSLIPATADVTAGLLSTEHDTPCGSFDGPGCDFLGGDCECETRSFTWSSCDGCGSSLGGERHALTVWSKS